MKRGVLFVAVGLLLALALGATPSLSAVAPPFTDSPLATPPPPVGPSSFVSPIATPDALTLLTADPSADGGRVTQQVMGTVLGAATDLWTGNGTFSFPIELPPGPGGFTPDLRLSYASESANAQLLYYGPDEHKGQAEYAGYGWSYNVPYISKERNEYTLHLGQSYELYHDGTRWRTRPEAYFDIQHDAGTALYNSDPAWVRCGNGVAIQPDLETKDARPWTVRTPDGTTYTFGDYAGDVPIRNAPAWAENHATSYYRGANLLCFEGDAKWYQIANKWGLVRARDRNGNEYQVTWHAPEFTPTVAQYDSQCWEGQYQWDLNPVTPDGERPEARYTRAFYPRRITYGAVVVELVEQGYGGTRPDAPPNSQSGQSCYNQKQFANERPAAVEVKVQNEVVRRYELRHAQLGSSNHLMLTEIALQGRAPAHPVLTTYTFQYQAWQGRNGVLLNAVNNGAGGNVLFSYTGHSLSGAANCPGNRGSRWQVDQRTVESGSGAPAVTQYSATGPVEIGDCEAGSYRFLGFGQTTEKALTYGSPTQFERQTVSYFHQEHAGTQADVRAGKLYRQEISGEGVGLLARQEWQWLERDQWPYLAQSTNTLFSQSPVTVTTRTAYRYADHGRVLGRYEYGHTRMVGNGSFEQGAAEWVPFWSPTPAAVVPEAALLGNQGLRLSGPAAGGLYQDISGLESGRAYLFRARVQALPGTTGAFQLWLHNTAGGNAVWSPAVTPATGWSLIEQRYVADITGRARLHLYYVQPGGGAIFVDDVWFEAEDEAGDERTTQYGYPPPAAGVHLYTAPGWENLYPGISENVGGPAMQSQRLYYYDGNTGFQQPVSEGNLTRLDHGREYELYYRTDYGYDEYGNQTLVQEQSGATTITTYDNVLHALPLEVSDATGTRSRAYDYGLALPVADYDANQDGTHYRYDAFGRLIKLLRPGDNEDYPTHRWEYALPYAGLNFQGMRIYEEQREQSGVAGAHHSTYSFYDGLGRAVQVRRETDNPTVQSVTDVAYDPLGRVVAAYLPMAQGATPEIERHGGWEDWLHTSTVYDALGRTVSVAGADGATTTSSYRGAWAAQLDPKGHQTLRRTDGLGRLAWVGQYQGERSEPEWAAALAYATASYRYDASDRLVALTGPEGGVTTIGYDAAGHKLALQDPDMGAWSYAYDHVGDLVRQTDAKAQTTCLYYDAGHRVTGKLYQQNNTSCPPPTPASLDVRYEYGTGDNERGRRTAASSYSGGSVATRSEWRYDDRGRVTSAVRIIAGAPAASYTTAFEYDAADRVMTTTLPSGERLNYTYGAGMQVASLASNWTTGALVAGASYDVAGRATGYRLAAGGNVLRQQAYYGWDAQGGRLAAITVTVPGQPAPVLDLSGYQYDPAGNLERFFDQGAEASFTYDDLDRVTSAYEVNYTYAPSGRLTSRSTIAGSHEYRYEDPRHPHAVTAVAGVGGYSYDSNGNQSDRYTAWRMHLDWDAENRLSGLWQVADDVVPEGAGAAAAPVAAEGTQSYPYRVFMPYAAGVPRWERYGYDADGVRVRHETPEATTYYVSPDFEVRVAAGGQISTTTYYTFNGQRVALRQPNGALVYLHADHLGSTLAATDAGGQVVAGNQPRYDAYGKERTGSVAGLPTDFRYTGQRQDGTGLYDYGARRYDPALGAFLSPDTIVPQPGNPQALNRYAYALGNPLKYRDPSGHWIESALDIAGIIFDANDIRTNGLNWENGLSLAADIGGLILPGVTGGGVLVRAVAHADDAADIVKAASHADDVAKATKTIVATGARAGEHVDDYTRWTKIAPEAYRRIRSTGDDVTAIAKNTNLPETRIQRIKQHLFENVHDLGDGRIDRYDPDPDIADAWDRLTRGEFTDEDLRLLDHEYFESRFEGIFGTDYDTAHQAAKDSGRTWDP